MQFCKGSFFSERFKKSMKVASTAIEGEGVCAEWAWSNPKTQKETCLKGGGGRRRQQSVCAKYGDLYINIAAYSGSLVGHK